MLLLASCSHRPRHPDPAVGMMAGVPAPAVRPAQIDDGYQISPTDMLEIRVFQEKDLTSELRVSNAGTIVFPLIGTIRVGGMTPQQAAQSIERRLRRGYLIDPQVSVTVMTFSKRRFTVLGQVQKPGSYDMPDQADVTVLQAIGMAGGYTRIANPSSVTLMRRTDGEERIFHLNAKAMASGDGQSAFAVVPGDVITVGESLF